MRELLESDVAALIRSLAGAYRSVETLTGYQRWADRAEADIQAMRKRNHDKNVDWWLKEAQVSAYYRSVQSDEIYPDDIWGVFNNLTYARLEQRKHERSFPAYWDEVKAKRNARHAHG